MTEVSETNQAVFTEESSVKRMRTEDLVDESNHMSLPAGTYYVGDVRDVIAEDVWTTDEANKDGVNPWTKVIHEGKSSLYFFHGFTSEGVGTFCEKGNEQAIYTIGESGMFCCLYLNGLEDEFASRLMGKTEAPPGHLHEFESPVQFTYHDGLFEFSSQEKVVAIQTKV
jgi:hypothetical protein